MDLVTFQIHLRKDRSMRNRGDTGRECRPSPRSLGEVSLAEKQEFRYNEHLLMTLVIKREEREECLKTPLRCSSGASEMLSMGDAGTLTCDSP